MSIDFRPMGSAATYSAQDYHDGRTGDTQRLRFISDAGHCWLAVPLVTLYEYGLEPRISMFSYVDARRGLAYLEEDCDAPLFLKALWDKGIDPSFEDVYDGDVSFVRKLPAFRPRPEHF